MWGKFGSGGIFLGWVDCWLLGRSTQWRVAAMCSGGLHIVQVDVPHTFGYLVLCLSILYLCTARSRGELHTTWYLVLCASLLSTLCLCTVRSSGSEPHTSRTISHKSDELRWLWLTGDQCQHGAWLLLEQWWFRLVLVSCNCKQPLCCNKMLIVYMWIYATHIGANSNH